MKELCRLTACSILGEVLLETLQTLRDCKKDHKLATDKKNNDH